MTAIKYKSKEHFLSCSSGRDLSFFLDIEYSSLIYHLYKVPDDKKYKVFSIPKKTGGIRDICAPISNLKLIQKALSTILYEIHKPKSSSHGFIKGRDIVSNARTHARKRYVLNIDLKDFFATINFGRVLGAFKSYPFNFNQNVAALLANVCCYKNALPQGSPASPIMSDIICVTLDKSLIQFAKEHHLTYTRYADDITFSSNRKISFENVVSTLNNDSIISTELESIIQSCGFNINHDKVRFRINKSQRVEVTGLTVNQFPNVRRIYIRNKINAVLHAIDKHGITKAQQKFNNKFDEKQRLKIHPNLFKVVCGRIGFIKHVLKQRPQKYRPVLSIDKIINKYKNLYWRENIFESIEQIAVGYDAIIVTEGKTDWMHLKAALSRLTKKDKFNSLNIKFYEYHNNMGNTTLEKFCLLSQKRVIDTKIICIFDSDVSETNKNVNNVDGAPRKWSNNLFSFSTQLPPHRNSIEEGCIEFYYTNDEILTFNENGQRLIFEEELKVRKEKKYIIDSTPDISKLKKKKILDNKVGQIINASGQGIGLTKKDFAESILESRLGFENFSSKSFELIFDTISKIVNV